MLFMADTFRHGLAHEENEKRKRVEVSFFMCYTKPCMKKAWKETSSLLNIRQRGNITGWKYSRNQVADEFHSGAVPLKRAVGGAVSCALSIC